LLNALMHLANASLLQGDYKKGAKSLCQRGN